MHELENVLGTREVAKAHAAEVAKLRVRRELLANLLGDRLRQQDLAAVRGLHDAGRSVDGTTEQVVVPTLDNAGMQSSANAQSEAGALHEVGKRLLQDRGRLDRVERIIEGRVHAVARHLEDGSTVLLDGGAGGGVVLRERVRHRPGIDLPKARAAFDVGEQQGCDLRGHGSVTVQRMQLYARRVAPPIPGGANIAVGRDGEIVAGADPEYSVKPAEGRIDASVGIAWPVYGPTIRLGCLARSRRARRCPIA